LKINKRRLQTMGKMKELFTDLEDFDSELDQISIDIEQNLRNLENLENESIRFQFDSRIELIENMETRLRESKESIRELKRNYNQ